MSGVRYSRLLATVEKGRPPLLPKIGDKRCAFCNESGADGTARLVMLDRALGEPVFPICWTCADLLNEDLAELQRALDGLTVSIAQSSAALVVDCPSPERAGPRDADGTARDGYERRVFATSKSVLRRVLAAEGERDDE